MQDRTDTVVALPALSPELRGMAAEALDDLRAVIPDLGRAAVAVRDACARFERELSAAQAGAPTPEAETRYFEVMFDGSEAGRLDRFARAVADLLLTAIGDSRTGHNPEPWDEMCEAAGVPVPFTFRTSPALTVV